MTLQQGEVKARGFARLIGDKCDRTMIVGSVRRQKSEGIKDIELVVEPKYVRGEQMGLFGDASHSQENLLWGYLKELEKAGVIMPRRNVNGHRIAWIDGKVEPRFVAMYWENTSVDLFICNADRLRWWGYLVWLRTGPSDANQLAVTQQFKGGIAPNDVHMNDGIVYKAGKPVDILDEEAMFKVLEIAPVAPHQRSAEAYHAAFWRYRRVGYRNIDGQ